MGRFTAAIAGAVVLAMTAGCSQEIVYREFFAPTDDVTNLSAKTVQRWEP